jgi:hypothetical protein
MVLAKDDKVYFSNDCCDDFELFKDYEETGSIIKFCEDLEKKHATV